MIPQNIDFVTELDGGIFGDLKVRVTGYYEPASPPRGISGPPENYDPGNDEYIEIYAIKPLPEQYFPEDMNFVHHMSEEGLEKLADPIREHWEQSNMREPEPEYE